MTNNHSLIISKKDLKQTLLILGVLLSIVVIFKLIRKPSVYDCMKLGSDDARFACLDEYYTEKNNFIVVFPIQDLSISEHKLYCTNSCRLKLSIQNNNNIYSAHSLKIKASIYDSTNNKIINSQELSFSKLISPNSTSYLESETLKKIPKNRNYKIVLTIISALPKFVSSQSDYTL